MLSNIINKEIAEIERKDKIKAAEGLVDAQELLEKLIEFEILSEDDDYTVRSGSVYVQLGKDYYFTFSIKEYSNFYIRGVVIERNKNFNYSHDKFIGIGTFTKDSVISAIQEITGSIKNHIPKKEEEIG